jgi:hypothetical protein
MKKKSKKVIKKGGGAKLKLNIQMFAIYKDDDDTITHQKNRCMCFTDVEKTKRCKKTVISGSDFCQDHQNCMGIYRQYLSGYEPVFNPMDWSHPYIESSHNCYSYFLDDKEDAIKEKCNELCLKNNKSGCPKKISQCGDLKPQPGDYFILLENGSLRTKVIDYHCPAMEKNILSDNPSIIKTKFNAKCPANYYKGAMAVDPNHTYHFYRQNPDGTWSHKPGTLPVTNIDANKRTIYAPHYANRNYENDKRNKEPIVYTDFCGYYCVPTSNYVLKNAV